MRVLVYGGETVVSRLKPLLDTMGFEILSCCNAIVSQNLPDSLENLCEVDFAILDTNEEGAELVGNYLGRLRDTPVALLIDRELADWERLYLYEACSYIPHSAGELEFACRLRKAISRIEPRQQFG